MAGLTSSGFEIKTLEQVESEMDDTLHSTISPTLNLTSTSAFGQLKSVTASHTSEVWDAALALYMSWDADTATGAALDRLGALTGALRRPATSSTATMTLSLLAGTYAPGDLVVSKVGDGSVRFSNDEELILGAPNAAYSAVFSSEETGPVTAGIGQLSVIEPVTGFVSATNAAAALVGSDAESDTDYRRRRALELASKGSTTVDAIRADLLQTLDATGEPMFEFASVLENDTDATVDGIPPHSFEALVISAATNQQIAETILLLKPAGIRAHGDTIVSVSDSQGNPHNIGFSVPTNQGVTIDIEVDVVPSLFPGMSAVQEAVTTYFLENQSVGFDVIHSAYVRVVMGVAGVIDCTVELDTLEANVVIDSREIATIAALNVAVTEVGGHP